ncbi:hypothetical protein BC828DRAFT_394714, partial [Blastocladiella britannica]
KKKQYFAAIAKNQPTSVRELLTASKDVTKAKQRGDYKFPKALELEALKFLGGYIGSLTGLQLAILMGEVAIARDIVDSSFQEDLDEKFGEIVKVLLHRGADRTIKNSKGFSPTDMAIDPEMQDLFTTSPTDLHSP